MKLDTSCRAFFASMARCVGLLVVFFLLVLPGWAQEFKLVADDAASGDDFGGAVALSGDYAIVGARFEGTGGDDFGAAYIFVRAAGGWTQQAKLRADDGEDGDRFGISVDISGAYAVVGATGEDDGGANAGAAYVFKRDGETWTQQARLTAADANEDDRFGIAVALSGDYIIVGAIGDDDLKTDAGAAYVFKRDGETWTEQVKINASDAVNGDAFGNAVALEGTTAVIAAVGDNFPNPPISGSAYVFVRDGEVWTEQDKIFASDGAEENFFGNAVALSGDLIIVGMSKDDDAGEDAGSAYVFARDGQTWTRQAKLVASDAAAGDEFGAGVAISSDYAIAGAPGDGDDAGAVYVFQRDDEMWGQNCQATTGTFIVCNETTKTLASDADTGDEFGASAALSGITALVGAPNATIQLTATGAAYVLALAPPAAPQLVDPPNQVTGLSTTVTLSWRRSDGADTYQVQVATTASFASIVAEASALADTTVQLTNLADNMTYFWRVAAVNVVGAGAWSTTRRFTVGTDTAIEQADDEVPAAYRLDPNYPNPFNPSTTLSFALPNAARITLAVYDATGALVTTLVDEQLAAGHYTTTWDAAGLASGVYVVQMRAEGVVQSRKVILLK